MSYTTNPHVPKARRLAVNDVRLRYLKVSFVARKYGVNRSTMYRWLAKASSNHREYIPTLPSRPKTHPNTLSKEIVDKVIDLRIKYNRCSPIIHKMITDIGYSISLSSVSRILRRYKLVRKKKQFKPRFAKIKRPTPLNPGDLVQMDTIHYINKDGSRFYIYTIIDLCTRFAYAEYSPFINSGRSIQVVNNAIKYFEFKIKVLQTDNGSEFSEAFYFKVKKLDIVLRYSRPRRPNDNAHIERFNRTIQEECFNYTKPDINTIQATLTKYIKYYNNNRLHLGINCLTPKKVLQRY